jgi:hypothetical protein
MKMKRIRDLKRGSMKSDEAGYILVLSLFVMVIATVVGLGLVVVGMNEFNLSNRTKLMDRAYDIAEAGINRAAVQLKLDPTLATTTQLSTHLYMQSGCTPQWQSGTPSGGPGGDPPPNSEDFEGGSYNVTLWQSERTAPRDETQNPQFKVVRSTGTIARGTMTAQRTIEARIVAGAPNTEYDASFDYCIYNGFNQQNGNGTWPSNNYWAGHWTWDAASPDANGHYPKGAIYTKGNINIPVAVAADLNIKGNIVATDNIYLANRFNWFDIGGDNSLDITNGNVVAGINQDHVSDDTDHNNIHINSLASGFRSAVRVYGNGDSSKGFLVAAKDVKLNSTFSFLSSPMKIGVNPTTGAIEGGIVAGRDIDIGGAVSIGAGMQIGKLTSGRETTIDATIASVTVDEIRAGQNMNDGGRGVNLNSTFISGITTGPISSWGQVDGDVFLAGIQTGNIYAGTNVAGDSGGTGVTFSGFGFNNVGNIVSAGSVSVAGTHGTVTQIASRQLLNANPYFKDLPPSNQPTSTNLTNPYGLSTPYKWNDKPGWSSTDILGAAGLTAPVNLIDPNWTYFQDQAAQDDVTNGPPTGPAHVISDGGPGDTGPAGDHKINLKWDITTPYSSNETVYNGDANSTVVIDTLNWTSHDSQVFLGTIVSKGPVLIQNTSNDMFVGTNNQLNICSGGNITFNASGVKVQTQNNSHFHFWSKGDIDLTYLTFNRNQNVTFYGSFTAGNQVKYGQNTWSSWAGGTTTFKWSRWPLAPQAWVAPVRVLSWKEL